jgi:hypothetical protein
MASKNQVSDSDGDSDTTLPYGMDSETKIATGDQDVATPTTSALLNNSVSTPTYYYST